MYKKMLWVIRWKFTYCNKRSVFLFHSLSLELMRLPYFCPGKWEGRHIVHLTCPLSCVLCFVCRKRKREKEARSWEWREWKRCRICEEEKKEEVKEDVKVKAVESYLDSVPALRPSRSLLQVTLRGFSPNARQRSLIPSPLRIAWDSNFFSKYAPTEPLQTIKSCNHMTERKKKSERRKDKKKEELDEWMSRANRFNIAIFVLCVFSLFSLSFSLLVLAASGKNYLYSSEIKERSGFTSEWIHSKPRTPLLPWSVFRRGSHTRLQQWK